MGYNKGDTVYTKLIHKTYDLATDTWSLADPDSGYPKITIKDSQGTDKVNAVQMTKVDNGKYEHLYQLSGDAVLGTWTGFIETSNSTYLDKQHFVFEVN